jgi:hypothetical protein
MTGRSALKRRGSAPLALSPCNHALFGNVFQVSVCVVPPSHYSLVFVSAARPNEIGNTESTAFLTWVRNTRPRLFLPTLVMAEMVAALSRTGRKPGLA